MILIVVAKGEKTLNFYFSYLLTTGFLPRDVLLAFFHAHAQGLLYSEDESYTVKMRLWKYR